MIDRRAWESACPSNCRKYGVGDALETWSRDCTAPRDMGRYEQFVAAKAAVLELEKALSDTEKKLARSEEAAWALLKNAKKFRESYAEKLREEYGRRLGEVTNLADQADDALDREIESLQRELVVARQRADEVRRWMGQYEADEQNDSLRDMIQNALEYLKEVKSVAKNDFQVFRDRLVGTPFRERGGSGLCDDRGVGGEDRQRVVDQFSAHMKKFKRAESLADELIVTMREAVVTAKNLATLADDTMSEVEKYQKILQTVGESLNKVYGMTEEVRSKRTNIDGARDARRAPEWASQLSLEQVRTERKAINDLVDAMKGYVDQVEKLQEKAQTIIEKAFASVPPKIARRYRIVNGKRAISEAFEQERRVNLERLDWWKNGVLRGERYLKLLDDRLKELGVVG